MLKSVFRTTQFKKDFKVLLKKHYSPDKLKQAIDALMAQNKQLLSTKYRDHPLTGNWKGYREIHIEGDWLVIYRVEKQELQLVLTRTGSHDDLF
ncbi:RelE/StbE family addiction module toxin [Bifidobacterium adolescentis]|jgi:mRNA interferase YafQ|uniref:RelE/StbE family addiction module toxin n=1 Tax=Bifidobacterium adolescentis TaxID=1680 RepID=A0A1X2ZBX5_BIFAD|nr:type II toxin-antitoxin system YafQ family toxin [Bifidobacterium adolescentis]MCT6789433.1 type II toxin-antitoxin system YafQ family toxin [Bifidobacterium adolescentis]MEE0905154.1 type II toxin-antitoxin system YafQ family toxin [Bifidobacterium adolescentis]NRD15265.1 type II toxin-antitoxin system YafQ family toxin [Bifidobacterium adolescentis]OSG91903.1 RelE/StbE family addiction module toxin [Bifidobacterium adolescentis]OSG99283.1 RelE/StbE family addiction module toxin [Bifidobac